jgi:hypothetical protein
VTGAACLLKNAGLISYRRGHVNITDSEWLERLSCECYELVRKEFTRLVGANGHARQGDGRSGEPQLDYEEAARRRAPRSTSTR